MTDLTHDRLRAVLDYDPGTGAFSRRIPTANGRYKAGPTGSRNDRYCFLWIDGKQYTSHRVAWFWMTGRWPDPEVDHENTDGFDNRWSNLREATTSQNGMNRRTPRHNTSGFKGVTFINNPAKCGSKPWKATIMKDGQRHFLGTFATAGQASAAYRAAAESLHGEFARAA